MRVGERGHRPGVIWFAAATAAAALVAALLLGASRPQPARAADCGIGGIATFGSGQMVIEGPGACSDHDEGIKVYCSGNLLVDYAFIDTNNLDGTKDTGVPCSSVVTVQVNGLNGNDRIEMTPVGSLRLVNGNSGNDTLQIRNGVNDLADCGDGVDSAQADQSKVDGTFNCEIQDFLPDAAPAPTAKKCKKKKPHHTAAAAKKCKKRRH